MGVIVDEVLKAIARLEAAALLRGKLGEIASPSECDPGLTDEEVRTLIDGAADGEVIAQGLADAARAELLELIERLRGVDPPPVRIGR